MRDGVTAMPSTPRRLSTEAALHDAARVVFAEKGYLNAKISDITAKAGRSVGSFYNYYDTKQQLLEAMLEKFPTQIVERARDRLTDDWTANVEAAVRAYVETFRDHLPEMIGVFQLSMTDPSAAAWWRIQRSKGVDAVLEVITAVESGGVTVDLDARVFGSAIVSMLESFCWTWLAAGGEAGGPAFDEDTAVHTLSQIWLRGMLNPTAADRRP
ncbi:TetR/AcrR family transcriptional regulator [Mycobacterium sp. NPDC006124]|uniref:TetR/AcrR family transcriptional regulator n=1 Tax=Mycobacterium sp. NPDC006124 TaxID=3156729 RepID=UPI0033A7909E